MVWVWHVSPYDAFSWPPLSWSGDEMWGRGHHPWERRKTNRE